MTDETYLSIAKFAEYQHYRDREPIWIKLYVRSHGRTGSVLDDKKLQALPPLTRLLWFYLLALAGRYQNAVPNSPEWLSRVSGVPVANVHEGVAELLHIRLVRETKTPRRMSLFASRIAQKRYTGCRRASNNGRAEHFVFDTLGVDDPPRDWPHERPSQSAIKAALAAKETT